MTTTFIMAMLIVALSLLLGGAVVMLLRRKAQSAPTTVTTASIAERARAVGKLVGLEVSAKEIATSTKGWSWMPPLVLSQARLAMIFHFEKQYAVDLARVRTSDVEEVAPGRYRLTLPPVDGTLRLIDVEPYDIQAGRVLGLLDVIQVNAPTQKDLMRRAQEQAAVLFTASDERYREEARQSVERHLAALLAMFGTTVEFEWSAAPSRDRLAEPATPR